MIFGGRVKSPDESGHVLGTAISGAPLFLLRRCSRGTWQNPVTQYDEDQRPAEESDLCEFVLS